VVRSGQYDPLQGVKVKKWVKRSNEEIIPGEQNKVQKWIPGIFLVKMTPSSCQSDQGLLRYEFLKFYLFATECEQLGNQLADRAEILDFYMSQ